MLTINVITLFPSLFENFLHTLPYKRAIDKNLIKINLVNLRDFAIDKRGTVDDRTFGGGTGMILMIEPIYKALISIYEESQHKEVGGPASIFNISQNDRIVVLSASGKTYNQETAKQFSTLHGSITFICGRYEGIDNRVEQYFATDTISIGNYVLSGGEIPTLAIIESVSRLLPGVLEKDDATSIESFENGTVEYPQYTRPESFMGMDVPEILLSGDHEKIRKWRDNSRRKI